MAGNVAEWCLDRYDEDYYKKSPYKNPRGDKKGTNRVIRGGSWHFNSWNIRAYARNSAEPSNKNYDIGFRLCMDWK